MVLTVGIKSAMCTCGFVMKRTGGTFGGDSPSTETYYCRGCRKHVIVVTPHELEQKEFAESVDAKVASTVQ